MQIAHPPILPRTIPPVCSNKFVWPPLLLCVSSPFPGWVSSDVKPKRILKASSLLVSLLIFQGTLQAFLSPWILICSPTSMFFLPCSLLREKCLL